MTSGVRGRGTSSGGCPICGRGGAEEVLIGRAGGCGTGSSDATIDGRAGSTICFVGVAGMLSMCAGAGVRDFGFGGSSRAAT